MRGTRATWGFKWAFLPEFLSPEQTAGIRCTYANVEHRCDTVNALGTAWECPIRPGHLRTILSPKRLIRLADSMRSKGQPFVTWERLQPRFWNSVIRTMADRLPRHNDMLAGNPGRKYAVVIFLNPAWSPVWGGDLVLEQRHQGIGRGIQFPIYPVSGACVVMEVNKHSYHWVAPLALGIHRHTIVGWLDDPAAPFDLEASAVHTGKVRTAKFPLEVLENQRWLAEAGLCGS